VTELLLVFLLSTCGAVVQSATGFGYGILVMSFFPLFLPTVSAVTVSGASSLLLSLIIGWRFRRYIRFRLIIAPLIAYCIVSSISVALSVSAADSVLKRALGIFLIVLSLYFIFRSGRFRIRPTPVNGLIAGGLSGVFSGFFGMGGPPMVVYMLSATDRNEEYMGTLQFYFFFNSIFTTTMRALHGAVTPDVVRWGGAAMLALIGGSAIGTYFFKKMDAATLRKLVYGFMIITGIIMLIKG